uniref:Uncharacterized protein n=1 Tax=Globodera rostochiensis TaxID=31243 RepID=A0A914I1V3_GLORO
MDNSRSGVTCCCGCVSIEKGTNVVASVLCVIDIISAISMFAQQSIAGGMISMVYAFACLLVIYAQIERKPGLFMPCLILGTFEVVARVAYMAYLLYSCVVKTPEYWEHDFFLRTVSPNGCNISLMAFFALCIPLYAWLYSIIYRGFLVVKKAESGRYRPPV